MNNNGKVTYQGDVHETNGCVFYRDHPTHLNTTQGSFAFEVTLAWSVNRGNVTTMMCERTYTGSVTPGVGVETVADLRRLVISYAKVLAEAPEANTRMLNVTPNKPIDQVS